jgi:hypothetical protein
MTPGAGTGPEVADTPISSLQPTLGERIPNLLMRNGYQTIEQVAATPDRDLLRVSKMGRRSLAELRAAISISPAAGQVPDRAVTLDVDQVRELRLLLGTLARWAWTRTSRRGRTRRPPGRAATHRHR